MENKEIEQLEDNVFDLSPTIINNKEELDKQIQEFKARTVWTKSMRKAIGVKFPMYKKESPKIGRNDKCSCGSDLKYKKCCGK